ncbi:protein ZNRD2-like isoform X2 [Gigantopelta aegis]|uniref:protein ZNRD2-like isoform X2 n=1 Tax=Gigantopelta aegis TaxID=1735272 RepID=UPI001B889564|nr:protein ZNRD2-like isoform X2 [Gigantopelta aegis]
MQAELRMGDCSDYDWQPPSEAEMKLIRARRDRSDKISKLMGDYLLKGYKMLSTVCDCGTILLQDRNGDDYCIACNELDSDTEKDDPLTNEAAALAQVREQELGLLREGGASPMSSVSDSPQVPVSERFLTPSTGATKLKTSNSTHEVLQRPANCSVLHNEIQCSVGDSQSVVDHVDALNTLNKKLCWATSELDKTASVEYSIQLCNLIKSCASAIQALKDL